MDARRIGNIVNLSTVLGLLLARLGRARVRSGPHGLLLAEGVRLPFPDVGAVTIGNVVLTTGLFADLVRALPRVLDHESRHASQWLRWGGLPFLPAYLLGVAWSLLIARDRAAGNPFERAAGLEDGGYRAAR
ncbi:hypothetical protein [uncultured Amnibacterium sp.]|uniref:hypothetical protein n=1 Tax=uncultured Amnibacterium sp. TaxID=1631851 RepID=UPI0035CA0917